MPQRHPVTTLASLPPGASRAYTIAGQRIALFNAGGTIHAMEDTCPHAGAPLSEGRLAGCVVTCPWHAISFDVSTGCVPGSTDRALATFPVIVTGDQVEIEL